MIIKKAEVTVWSLVLTTIEGERSVQEQWNRQRKKNGPPVKCLLLYFGLRHAELNRTNNKL